MVQIVSGMTRSGEIRLIGQVASGLQQDLYCPVCLSPLVAKKGEINDWHFAHENGNQSPRCIVGARNLLRRTVKQHIAATGKIPSPIDYHYTSSQGGIPVSARVNPVISSVLSWCEDDDSSTHLADISLSDGTLGQIHLSLSEDPPPRLESNKKGMLSIVVDESALLQLNSVECIAAGLMPKSTARWSHLPDSLHEIQEARKRAAAETHERTIGLGPTAGQGRAAQTRHDAITRASHQMPTKPVAMPQPSWKDDYRLHWAAELKPYASIFCMQMKDGSDWFIYETETRIHKLKPWPALFEGWDEFFPPKIGTADERMGCYAVQDFGAFLLAISSYIKGMMNTSNPNDVVSIFEGFVQDR